MSREEHVMSMSEVQKLTGLSARTLQYYDDMGYLRVGRDDHGYRIYTDKDLQDLFVIILLKEMGFSLEETARLLNREENPLSAARNVLKDKVNHLEKLIEAVSLLAETDIGHLGFDLFDPHMIRSDPGQIIRLLKSSGNK